MVTKGYNIYKTLIVNILINMKNINACRQRFMVEAVTLFLSIKGRINFRQLERYGKYSEQRYRIQFEKPFDFMAFNSGLVKQHGSGHYIIALDPSFIAKSGKKTPGIGYFWSGQAAPRTLAHCCGRRMVHQEIFHRRGLRGRFPFRGQDAR